MTKDVLLHELKAFTENATQELIMPVRQQKGDAEQQYRAADVYLMRLPDSASATKKAPYILHQIITGKDIQPQGERVDATATVRSVFCVYHDDESEGALLVVNLMERLRVALLRQAVIGSQFTLDLRDGLESVVYTDNTAPYFIGEMISVWQMPAVEREVIL